MFCALELLNTSCPPLHHHINNLKKTPSGNPNIQTLGILKIKNIKLYPNPANTTFELSGLTQAEKVSIYNVLGTKVFEGTIDTNQKVDVQNLTNGLYFLNFENGSSLKFIKE